MFPKNRKSLVVLLVLSLPVGACDSTRSWVRKDSSAQVVKSTLAACSLDAEGRVPFGGDEVARAAHVARLTRLCMESQGFELREDG